MDSKSSAGDSEDGLRRSRRSRTTRVKLCPDSPISSKKSAMKRKKTRDEDSDSNFSLSYDESSSTSSTLSNLENRPRNGSSATSKVNKKPKMDPRNIAHIPLGRFDQVLNPYTSEASFDQSLIPPIMLLPIS